MAFAKAKVQPQEPASALAELDRQLKAASEAEAAHNCRLEQTVNEIRAVEQKLGDLDVEYVKACRRSADGDDVDLLAIDNAIRVQRARLNGLQQVEAELREEAKPLTAAKLLAWAVWRRAENAAELERLRELERTAVLKRDAAKADTERAIQAHSAALNSIARHMKQMDADEKEIAQQGVPSKAALDWEETKRRAIA